jgi:hypothetical protein
MANKKGEVQADPKAWGSLIEKLQNNVSSTEEMKSSLPNQHFRYRHIFSRKS